jgi:chemotaxis protein MotA
MDFASIIGLILGFSSLVLGYKLSGGNLNSLMLFSAIVIVGGGTLGAVILSFGVKQLRKLPLMLFQAFIPPKSKINKTMDFLVMLSEHARKDGLLSLEKILESEEAKSPIDPLLKRGAMMVIDGADLQQIRELLETISTYMNRKTPRRSPCLKRWGLRPAFGMIGTIVGLIQVLANMDSPEQMATSIGVAFNNNPVRGNIGKHAVPAGCKQIKIKAQRLPHGKGNDCRRDLRHTKRHQSQNASGIAFILYPV